MRLDKLRFSGFVSKDKHSDSYSDHNSHQNQVVEVLCDHIERHVRGHSDHVYVSAISQNKNG